MLLPPHSFSSDFADDCALDDASAIAVLGTMVEHRRRSSVPAACEVAPEYVSDYPDSSNVMDDLDAIDDSDAIATQRRATVDVTCDAFMKIR